MPPPHHKRYGSRSRSPGHRRRNSSNSRSPSPGKHRPHSRSNSPEHGRKHDHGKKHGHKKKHGHGPKHSHDDESSEEEERDASEEEDDVEAPEEAEPEPKPKPKPHVKPHAKPVVAAATAATASKPSTAAVKEDEEDASPKFFMSQNYGGEGGEAFDHMNRRRITKITVRAGKFVDGISTTYMNGETLKNGGDGGEEQSMVLSEGEYINEVKLREGNVIQSITFITNRGNQLGPCGSGKGGGLFAQEGKGVQVKAPDGYCLVGLKGREGKWLDAIGFRWGPVPKRSR